MREVTASGLLDEVDDPFVVHQVDPATTRRAWLTDDGWQDGAGAVVIDGSGGRPGGFSRSVLTVLGSPVAAAGLLADVAASGVPAPERLLLDAALADAGGVPAAYALDPAGTRRWLWMLTRRAPEPVPGEDAVEVVPVDDAGGASAVEQLLDAGNPTSFARPGTPGVEAWLGVRDESGGIVAAGAVVRFADGTGHLRGVTVHPRVQGRGLGRALSAAMTRRALAGASATATLGVYVDNAAAIGIYERLGYAVRHTFVSGPTVGLAH